MPASPCLIALSDAAEQYLLGEMPAECRDVFEAHYFTCPECAAELREASEIINDIRAALKATPS